MPPIYWLARLNPVNVAFKLLFDVSRLMSGINVNAVEATHWPGVLTLMPLQATSKTFTFPVVL
jgi:hypothetical protein